MFNEYCKNCHQYVKAIDGKIVHEVCLISENRENYKCIYLAFINLTKSVKRAVNAICNGGLNRNAK